MFGEFFPSPGGKPLTAAARARMSPSAAFGSEVIGTAILLLLIFCASEKPMHFPPGSGWMRIFFYLFS